MSLINGTGTSTFIRIEGAGSSPDVSTYTFPLCNENGGLKEGWEWKGIRHDLLSYKLSSKHHGYRLIWDFNPPFSLHNGNSVAVSPGISLVVIGKNILVLVPLIKLNAYHSFLIFSAIQM